MAIRCTVRQIRSDQGSNFVGAKNELNVKFNDAKVVSYLAQKQCDFVLNAPSSSHIRGVWERQIRTIRNVMNSVLSLCPGRLDDSSLRTLFYEVMAIINSRPLTVSDINVHWNNLPQTTSLLENQMFLRRHLEISCVRISF